MKRLHDVAPSHKKDLTEGDQKKAMDSFLFLIEKETKLVIKSRHVADGNAQRPFVDKKDAASSTMSNNKLFVTVVVDVQEQRDAASLDMPNVLSKP